MKILYVASEAAPFCKTGGLADVAGSLPPALAANGDQVAAILPLYSQIGQTWREKMTFVGNIYVDLAWRHEYCGLFSLKYKGVKWYFVDNERYFRRDRLYGEYDDGERFAFFCRAVMDLLPSLDWMPEIIHCNDWQTALVPIYLKDESGRWADVRNIKSMFTIHNIEYQGKFGDNTVVDLFGLDYGWYEGGKLQMDGCVNLLKGAMLCADSVTTVSPTYARQLHQPFYAHGLESIADMISDKLQGVLNGLDVTSFDPATDRAIPQCYRPENLRGKAFCKAELQRHLGLEATDAPLIAIVSRLVAHKGVDLIRQVLDGIMDTGAQLVVLGMGESEYEDFFRWAESRYPGRLSAQITYSDKLARQIYAGADLFLMPSKSEPCGLSQMIAMRYGAVPIVRQTGGLADTVRSCQVGQEDGNGYVFANYNAYDMLYTIKQAVGLYRGDPDGFQMVQLRGMTDDFSWTVSAKTYRDIYASLLG